MALILNIETATNICSVTLAIDGKLLDIKETNVENSHSSVITVFIDEILKNNSLIANNLDAIAVSKGPGSYTGLRIGVSTAKGLCYSIDKPLISIDTLKSMASGAISFFKSPYPDFLDTLYCPMIDARRMEVYCTVFNKNKETVKEVNAEIIDENSFSDLLLNKRIVFFGDGAEKCKDIFKHNHNAVFIDYLPTAKDMILLSEEKYLKSDFENIAYFEPYYLKEFVAAKPVVKGLQ